MIPALLLQAAADHAPGIEGEIAGHPYLTTALICFLFAALVGLAKLFVSRMEGRINEKFAENVEREDRQDGRLDRIDAELRRYDTHVAVGVKESTEIHESIRRVEAALVDHTQKEESVTWKKIDDLVEAVNTMRLSNEVAHATLNTGQATLNVRVEAMEKKMPNGELSKLAEAFAALSRHRDEERADRVAAASRSRAKRSR